MTGLEPRPLADGRLAFFDGVRDVGQGTVSDTVARLVYVLTALYSNNVTSAGGYTLKPIVMLEDVEAHVYPAALHYIVDAAVEAIKRGVHVVASTHSGRFASLLWEKTGATIYYVNRGAEGTRLYKVNPRYILELEEEADLDQLVEAYSKTRVEEFIETGVLSPV